MKLIKENFGEFKGSPVTLYRLSNDNGMEVDVIDYGLTVTSIRIPNGDGTKDNVVCGFNTLESYFGEEYKANAPYFGAVVGRYCSTIKGAKYGDFQLTANCGEDNLHGGFDSFDKSMWQYVAGAECNTEASIKFVKLSADGENGFPGNIDATVTIKLTPENELSFHYEAFTDKVTPYCMTNHTYFNLSGFRESIEGHKAQVNSTIRIPLNFEGSYAESQKSVAGAADDLTEAKVIGDVHAALGSGFEHYYLFDGLKSSPREVAKITYPGNGRTLTVSTTEHGMLFYTAIYTSDALCRESGEKYGKYRAFCCESHRIPNGPNLAGAPDVFLSPGEKFESETVFKFGF